VARPPSNTQGILLQDIKAQDWARLVIGGEFFTHGWRVAIGTYGLWVSQATSFFTDYTLPSGAGRQELLSGRVGGAANTERPWRWRGLTGSVSMRLSLDG
jgi:hypothetical protein